MKLFIVLSVAAVICALWFVAGYAVGLGIDGDYIFRMVATVCSVLIGWEAVERVMA